MFCKYCGKEIENDSVFCKHCGEKVIKEEPKCEVLKEEEKKESSGLGFLLVVIVLLSLCMLPVLKTCANNLEDGNSIIGIFERNIKQSDYSVKTSQGLTSMTVIITPNVKIEKCEVAFTLYDSNGNKIYSDTVEKTNLTKGSGYAFTFDYGFVNALSGSRVSYKITGKTKG